MLRLAPSLLGIALILSAAPSLADDAPSSPSPQALPPVAASPYPPPPPYGPWPRPPVPTESRSSSAVAAGVVFTVIGSIGLSIGTGVYLGASSRCDFVTVGPGGQTGIPFDCTDTSAQIAGMSFLIASAALVGGAVGLWVWGAQQVPKEKKSESTTAMPAIRVGPRSAALTWSF